MILIVSHERDDHAAAVLGALRRTGHPVVMLDTARYPEHVTLRSEFTPDGTRWWVRGLDGVGSDAWVDLAGCHAAWWRRPQPYELNSALHADAQSWVYQECHEAMAGLFAGIPATWINDPDLNERAAHKPYQLALAARLGIPIPPTLVTNDPASASQFVATHRATGTIFKTFRATEQHWRETRLVGDAELERLDSLRYAPTIFQARVEAVADLRITVIGERVFATEIAKVDGLYGVDYRMSMEHLDFRPVELPALWIRRLHDLMRHLGLVYGAIDLMRTADGDYVFLEINPAGEWLFVSERSGQPITEAMADHLISLDHH